MKGERKTAPVIRFKGFSDAWEQRKLEELATFSKGNSYTKNDLIDNGKPIILYGRLYTRYQTVIEAVDTFAKEKFNSVISEGNEVLVPASGETSEEISRASVIGKSGVVLGGDLNIIKPNESIDSIFLALTISNGGQKKELSKRAQGKSVVHLHNSDLKQVNLLYPKLEEQQKIGIFFKQLDDTIALHQRKLDSLKLMKKGFLQQMFPGKGEKVPRLRFADFPDEWEQCIVSDFTDKTYGGGTPKTNIPEYWTGEIPWIQSSDLIKDDFFNVAPKKHITEDAIRNSSTKLVPSNSITVVTRVGVGKLAFMPFEYATSQDFLSLSNLKVSLIFGVYSLYNMLQKELNNIQGTSIKGITKSDLLEKSITIPVEVEEQKKIGFLFKQLDDIILFHKNKLNQFQALKKAYLQNMFI
ncbi:restriction endonuclease subunit S [Listeria seeligeri]|uniref:restriction endonuclease subunit S n=1 Tax=Listeria seeligeri TaxID=1640 RepID=UPI002F41091B